MPARKAYVGDGVYVEFSQSQFVLGEIILTTENGLEVTNRIVLDYAVWMRLVELVTNRLERGE